MIRYKTRTHLSYESAVEIEEVDIVRETASSVFILRRGKERREGTRTEWAIYHETREKAIDYLERSTAQFLQSCEKQVEVAKRMIAKVGELKA